MDLNRVRSNNFDEEFGVEKLDVGLFNVDGSRWLFNGPLGRNLLPFLVGFSLLSIIFLNSLQKFFPASRQPKMLDSDVNTLRDDPVSDLLVYNETD